MSGGESLEPYIKEVDIFEGIECGELRKIVEVVIERQIEPGTTIFSAQEKADYVYMIRQGRVKLYRLTEDGREIVVAMLGPGDIFGEFVFGEQLTHSVFAQSFEHTWLCMLPRDGFFSLLANEPKIAVTIISNIGRRLAVQALSVETLSTFDVEERFCKLLLCLVDQFGDDMPGLPAEHKILTITLTHQDQANMVFVTLSTRSSIGASTAGRD